LVRGIGLGGDRFWEGLRRRLGRELHRKTDVERISGTVAAYYGRPEERVGQRGYRRHPGSQIALYLVRNRTDLFLNEIGSFLGNRHCTAGSAAFRRVEIKRQQDKGFDTELKKISFSRSMPGGHPRPLKIFPIPAPPGTPVGLVLCRDNPVRLSWARVGRILPPNAHKFLLTDPSQLFCLLEAGRLKAQTFLILQKSLSKGPGEGAKKALSQHLKEAEYPLRPTLRNEASDNR